MSRKESERTYHLTAANLKMPAPSSFPQMAYAFSPEETEEERSASGIFTSAQRKSD